MSIRSNVLDTSPHIAQRTPIVSLAQALLLPLPTPSTPPQLLNASVPYSANLTSPQLQMHQTQLCFLSQKPPTTPTPPDYMISPTLLLTPAPPVTPSLFSLIPLPSPPSPQPTPDSTPSYWDNACSFHTVQDSSLLYNLELLPKSFSIGGVGGSCALPIVASYIVCQPSTA